MEPKATPIDNPSGILCMVIELTSKNILLAVSFFFCFAINFENILSVRNNNNPPHKNPTGTIIYGKKAILIA